MKICFQSPPGELSDTLQRSIQSAFGTPVTALNTIPSIALKESIQAADLVLIDATAANTLATYTLGLADAFNKRVILISPIEEPLPAFFEKHRLIVHRWNLDHLKQQLAPAATPDDQPQITDDTPTGKFHQLFGDLLKTHGYVHRGPVEFDGSTFTVREQDMDFALVQEIAHRAKSLNLRVRLL
jgi:hypothetical protein